MRREPPCSDIGLTARHRRVWPPAWLAVTLARPIDTTGFSSHLNVHSVAHAAVRDKMQFPASGNSTDAVCELWFVRSVAPTDESKYGLPDSLAYATAAPQLAKAGDIPLTG